MTPSPEHNKFDENQSVKNENSNESEESYFLFLNKSFGNNVSVKLEMLNIFCTQIPITRNQLQKALAEADLETFHFDIHRIKSTILIIGLPQLAKIAQELENISEQGENTELLKKRFIDFEKQVAEDLLIINTEINHLKSSLC